MNTYSSELSWELLFFVPYIYDKFLKGEEYATHGCVDTDCFYFFSDMHTSKIIRKQDDSHLHGLGKLGCYPAARQSFYQHDIPLKYNIFPNFREFYSEKYQNLIKKPLVVINNKSTSEWGFNYIRNRIELNEIEEVIKKFSGSHQIVYIRPSTGKHISDDAPEIEWDDKDKLKQKFGDLVLLDTEFMGLYGLESYNTMQCVAHSYSALNVTIGGGNAILASLFGAKNIIMTKCDRAVKRKVWHTDSYLRKISGAKIIGVHSREQLMKELENISV